MQSKHHDQKVSIRESESKVLPEKWEVGLNLGDTVRYLPDLGTGTLTIRFKDNPKKPDDPNKSPFIGLDGEPMMTVVGGTFVTIAREGEFFCGCTFTFVGGKRIGWDKNNADATSESGGSHNVPDKRKSN